MDGGQKWAVAATRSALLDAGWPDWTVDPERVAVIIGNAIGGDKQHRSNLRIQFPAFARELSAASSFAALPDPVREAVLAETRASFLAGCEEINEDTMPGELANVIAGRVANLFNFRGPNFTTDAACASGLAAMSAAMRGLQAGDFDAAIAGRRRPQHGRSRIREVLQDRRAVGDRHPPPAGKHRAFDGPHRQCAPTVTAGPDRDDVQRLGVATQPGAQQLERALLCRPDQVHYRVALVTDRARANQTLLRRREEVAHEARRTRLHQLQVTPTAGS